MVVSSSTTKNVAMDLGEKRTRGRQGDQRLGRNLKQTGTQPQVRDPGRCVLDPRKHRFLSVWDVVMVFALGFTAIVTPVEVALIDEGPCLTPLFMVNRFIDVLFGLDMMVIFNTAFQEQRGEKTVWVYSRCRIACRYAKSWFLIDFVSVMPFWLTGFLLLDPPAEGYFGCIGAVQAVVERTDAGGDSDHFVKIGSSVRVVRLLRMLKLARIFKATRVLKRIFQDVLMTKLEFTFAGIKLLQLFFMIIIVAHWQACLWAGVATYIDQTPGSDPTWIDTYRANQLDLGMEVGGFDIYVAALYFSVMTLTSIGYGDMIPVNTTERMVCAVSMIISAVSWTYVLGTAAGIAATLDPNNVVYQTTMDQLNHFMRQRHLPREMRLMLRDYFAAAREVHQVSGDAELLAKMSPLLQGTVACCANKPWLDKIWFLRNMDQTREERDFVADLSMKLRTAAFVANERLPLGQLYILRKGMVTRLWRFLGQNAVWGEDVLLDSSELMCHAQAVALTYVEVFTLSPTQFAEVAELNPMPMRKVRARMRRMTVYRAVIRHLKQANGDDPPRSFIPKSDAQGFVFSNEAESLDEKLTRRVEEKLTAFQPPAAALPPRWSSGTARWPTRSTPFRSTKHAAS